MLDILKKLISIESLSYNEQAITNWVEVQLKMVPGSCERLGNTLVYKNVWQAQRPVLALGAHLDTVPFEASDWQVTAPCTPRQKNKNLYGRGACDMKGGAAIILDLILNQQLGELYNVMAFFYDREEIGTPNGVTDLITAGYFKDVDFCIIPEPTECKVSYGVFGNLDGRFISTGTAAHSSRPERGKNAIYGLMEVLDSLKKFPLNKVNGLSEALSVNLISGGRAINMVPDKAELRFDFRFDPQRDLGLVTGAFKALEQKHLSFKCDGLLPGVVHNVEQNPYLKKLISLSADGGIEPFWSDIAQLGQAGVVAVNFGPGSIKQAHQADEFVPLEDLHKVWDVLHQFLGNE